MQDETNKETPPGLATALPPGDVVAMPGERAVALEKSGKGARVNRIVAQMAEDPKRAAVLKEFRALCRGVIGASESYLDAYREMCRYIRKHQLSPSELKAELSTLGFTDSRISEIKRICNASPEIFKDFEKRAIGFKVALTKAREDSQTAETSAAKKFMKLAARLLKYFAVHKAKKTAHLGETALVLLHDKDFTIGEPKHMAVKGYELQVVRVDKTAGEKSAKTRKQKTINV